MIYRDNEVEIRTDGFRLFQDDHGYCDISQLKTTPSPTDRTRMETYPPVKPSM